MAHVVHVTTIPATLYFLRGQPAYLRERGHHVTAVASPDVMLDRFGTEESVQTHAVPMTRAISPFRDLLSLSRLIRLFGRIHPDVVHAHTPKAGLLAMIAAAMTRVPLRVYHVHGLPLSTATGVKRALLSITERVACRLAHRVLCVSASVREQLVREGLCPADRVTVPRAGSIGGVDSTDRFQPARWRDEGRDLRNRLGIPASAPVLGFIGRVVREKGVDELAAAWALVEERVPGAHLIVVGPLEPHDPPSPEALHRLQADPRVHMVGTDWETPPYYAAMDVLTLPSYREGYPVVVLEASAMSVPVVATAVQGCVDAVVDGVSGTLVPPRDVEALAQAIERYMNNADLRSLHGEQARARVVADYRPEDLWAVLESLYSGGGVRPERIT